MQALIFASLNQRFVIMRHIAPSFLLPARMWLSFTSKVDVYNSCITHSIYVDMCFFGLVLNCTQCKMTNF